MTDLWTMLAPVTALFDDPTFPALPNRTCALRLSFEGENFKETNLGLRLRGIEVYRCTDPTSCTPEMFQTAQGKVVGLGSTDLLVPQTNAGVNGAPQRHPMITFDGPCYEFICTDVEVSDIA